MADLEITFASVSIPTNTSVTLTVEEDPDTDGTFENSNSTGLTDGQTSYTLSGFDGTGDVRVTLEPDNTDDVSAAEVGEPVDVSTKVTAAPDGPVTVNAQTNDIGNTVNVTASPDQAISVSAQTNDIGNTVNVVASPDGPVTVNTELFSIGGDAGTTPTGYRSTITQLDGTVTDFNRIISTELSLEHTALHVATLTVVPEVNDPTNVALGDLDVDLDNSSLFRGEITEVTEDEPIEGYATIRAAGPGLELTREAPNSAHTYTNTSRFDAINDYLNNHLNNINADVTVSEPSPTILEDDVRIVNAPSGVGFQTEFSIDDDVPAQFNNNEIQLQQHGFPNIESDFTGTYTANVDSSGDSYFHINAEYATLTSGDDVNANFTPNHNIPSERVAGVIHYKAVDPTTNVDDATFKVDGTSLGFAYQQDEDPVSGDMRYAVFDSGEYDSNGGSDLSAGVQSSISFSVTDTAEIEVDYLYVFDTDYPPANYDEPDSFEDTISGPSFYPGDVELTSVRHFEEGNVREARLETEWNDTSNDQRLSLSNTDGDNYLNGSNTSNFTADFDGNDQFGVTVRSKVRLSGTDDGNGVWVSNNANGQNLEDYQLFVTVDDTAIIDDLTVRDKHFENLKSLHQGEWRFVVDPTIRDPVTIESFRDGRNGSKKSDSWRTTNASQTRDVRDYGNQILFIFNNSNGNRDTITVQRAGEVGDKDNTVIQIVEETTTQFTQREARIEAINRLDDAIAIDNTTGSIEAWAKLILPGYTYDVPEWGIEASITRTRYSESSDSAIMNLQFVRDRDVTQQVIDNI